MLLFQSSCNQECVDIDECSLVNGGDNVCLNGFCENLIGGFRCECHEGFRLDAGGVNCTDIDECADPQTCRRGECVNTDGSYECQCPENFELLSSGMTL